MHEEPTTLQTLSSAAVSIIGSIFSQNQQAPTQPAAPVAPSTVLPALGGGTLLVVGAAVVFFLFFRR